MQINVNMWCHYYIKIEGQRCVGRFITRER